VVGHDIRLAHEAETEKLVRAVKQGTAHLVQREVRFDLRGVQIVALDPDLLGVVAPIPGLNLYRTTYAGNY